MSTNALTGTREAFSPQRVVSLALLFLRRQPALAALILACVAASVRYETFATPENLFNVLRQNSMVGLLSLGMLLAMLSGGIDLSLGAMLAVGGVVAAALSGYGGVAAVAGAVATTGLLGLGNGLLITRARVQPFIATLAMNMAARGLLLYFTEESPVRMAREATDLKWVGRGWVGPVPVPVLILLGAYAIAGLALRHTRFGLHVYSVGDNVEAARLLGLNVNAVRTRVYALSGALGGLGGALLAARLGVGQPTAGLGWELTAITAVLIGATAAEAGAFSTLVGLLLLAVLFNALNLEGGITSYWQWVLRGVFLLLAVVTQHLLRERRGP